MTADNQYRARPRRSVMFQGPRLAVWPPPVRPGAFCRPTVRSVARYPIRSVGPANVMSTASRPARPVSPLTAPRYALARAAQAQPNPPARWATAVRRIDVCQVVAHAAAVRVRKARLAVVLSTVAEGFKAAVLACNGVPVTSARSTPRCVTVETTTATARLMRAFAIRRRAGTTRRPTAGSVTMIAVSISRRLCSTPRACVTPRQPCLGA
jgi:hypothetical protein